LSLAHYIDVEFLHEALRRTRKDGAPGVDGQTGKEYEERLEEIAVTTREVILLEGVIPMTTRWPSR
jgi:hypothetical protein